MDYKKSRMGLRKKVPGKAIKVLLKGLEESRRDMGLAAYMILRSGKLTVK